MNDAQQWAIASDVLIKSKKESSSSEERMSNNRREQPVSRCAQPSNKSLNQQLQKDSL